MVSKELQPDSQVSMRRRWEEPRGSLTPKNSPHPDERDDPPRYQKRWKGLGRYAWNGLRHYVRKVLGFLGIWR